MNVFQVDFNEANRYGHVSARSDKVNDRVSLLDHDGNYCEGVIVAVRDNGFIDIEPDFSTWVPCGEPIAGPVTSDDPPRPAPEIYLG